MMSHQNRRERLNGSKESDLIMVQKTEIDNIQTTQPPTQNIIKNKTQKNDNLKNALRENLLKRKKINKTSDNVKK